MKRSLLAVVACFAAVVVASDKITLPDPKEGQINGTVAVLFWPASSTAGGKVEALLPASDCEVVVAPWTNLSAELTYPCGRWFQPPDGRYRVWLEKSGRRITGTTGTFNYAAVPFTGRGSGVVIPVDTDAGRVILASGVTLPPNAELRLVNLDSCCTPPNLTHPFDRRATTGSALLRSGLLMPVGRVFAGIFDRTTNEAFAIAQPVLLEAGKVAAVAPKPPVAGTSDVYVSLMRPRQRGSRDVDTADVTLGGRKPQMLFDGSDRIYAAWYGVKGASAELAVASKTLRLAPRTLKLPSGRVVVVRDELRTLPSVGVSLLAPAGSFDGEKVRIEARQPAHAEALRGAAIRPGGEVRFEALPAEPLDLVLGVGPWQFRRHVDLTSGADERVVFDLHPIVVSGEVFYGREKAASAEVAFRADAGYERVKSDDAGRYRITLWRGDDAWMAEVTIPERAGPPFVEGFVQINESRTLDFHVPHTQYTVRVVDADSGRAIAGAAVSAANLFTHSSGEEATLMQSATSDADGVATLAPLRPGRLEVRARAEGYIDSDKIDGRVESDEGKGALEVRLRSVGETVALHVRTSDGRPVPDGELWAVGATQGIQRPLWRGATDAEGAVSVPRNVDGSTLLIRSRSAASAVRVFRADSADRDLVLQPAAPPMRVAFGSPRTRIALWIDGARISGPAVTFLTWSSEVSGSDGVWSAENLPRQPLRLLAWRNAPEVEITAGLRDASATIVPYPWPASITVAPAE